MMPELNNLTYVTSFLYYLYFEEQHSKEGSSGFFAMCLLHMSFSCLMGYPSWCLQYIERQNIPPSPFIDQTNFALPQPGAHLQQINQKMSLELAPPAKGTMRVQQKIIDKDKLPQGEDTFQLTPFFQEKKVRQLFVRKVLILVLLQLLLTIGVSIAALYVEPIKVKNSFEKRCW